MLSTIQTWAGEVGTRPAQVALLRLGLKLPTIGTDLRQARDDLKLDLADRQREAQPLEALALYTQLFDRSDAQHRSGEIIETLIERWPLLLEERTTVDDWLAASAKAASAATLRPRVQAALTAAEKRQTDPKRRALLEAGTPAELRRYAAKHPNDLDVVLRLALVDLTRGDPSGAEKRLLAWGPAPWLTLNAQTVLARIWAQTERANEAEQMLEAQVARRVPRLQAARTAFFQHLKRVEDGPRRRAQRGDMPSDLQTAVDNDDGDAVRERFDAWVSKTLEADPRTEALRTRYQQESIVVEAAVDLGALRLERANAATGDARDRLLAEAERAFLSVSEEGRGMPSYHLGLGSTFHRLGKRADGDQEFLEVLALDAPRWTLAVANAYRELGLEPRARELAEPLTGRSGPFHDSAVNIMLTMAYTLPERQRPMARIRVTRPSPPTSVQWG